MVETPNMPVTVTGAQRPTILQGPLGVTNTNRFGGGRDVNAGPGVRQGHGVGDALAGDLQRGDAAGHADLGAVESLVQLGGIRTTDRGPSVIDLVQFA